MNNTITLKGKTLIVQGNIPKTGEKAPNFSLLDLNDNQVSLSDFTGKKVLISVFPDINTRVCDLQTVHFFKIADTLENTVILNISNNTKEEFKEWCAVKNVDAIMLSDQDKTFAETYGLWIPEMEKLARSIFVVDEEGTLVYKELVPEVSSEPDYDNALEFLK